MGILDKLWSKKTAPTPPVLSGADKETLPVLPLITRMDHLRTPGIYTIPFLQYHGDETALNIAFTQEAGGTLYYLTEKDLENPAINSQFLKWRENIDSYVFEPYLPQKLNLLENVQNRIVFAAGHYHSSEKILSAVSLTELCDILQTDQIIVSIPRRGLLMATSYDEDFMMLENFFFTHQDGWQNDNDGSEFITDLVFVANKTGIMYAATIDFRINLYEQQGRYKLSYSTTGELFEKDGAINFRAILERNKINVQLPA